MFFPLTISVNNMECEIRHVGTWDRCIFISMSGILSFQCQMSDVDVDTSDVFNNDVNFSPTNPNLNHRPTRIEDSGHSSSHVLCTVPRLSPTNQTPNPYL